jgi:hypothetical protein
MADEDDDVPSLAQRVAEFMSSEDFAEAVTTFIETSVRTTSSMPCSFTQTLRWLAPFWNPEAYGTGSQCVNVPHATYSVERMPRPAGLTPR